MIGRVGITRCRHCGCEIDCEGLRPFVGIVCPECEGHDIVPGLLGPFVLEDVLGSGGMGSVYKGKDLNLDRPVAIKVLKPAEESETVALAGFRKEAQAIARLNHPNIVQVYSYGQHEGRPYLVMEYVPGENLHDIMGEHRRLDPLYVMQVALEVAKGLSAACAAGVIHGDVKPQNVLFDDRGIPKLADFGLASFEGDAAAETVMGTPIYISPERVRRETVDERADIYSLGATVYHALAGRPPFTGSTVEECTLARLNQQPRRLQLLRRPQDLRIWSMVKRMMERERSQRYPNYISLIGDLRRIVIALGGERKRPLRKPIRVHGALTHVLSSARSTRRRIIKT